MKILLMMIMIALLIIYIITFQKLKKMLKLSEMIK